MSYVVRMPLARRRHLVYEEPYFSSDPRNPALPLVGEGFRVILTRSIEALSDYLVPVTHSYGEFWSSIQVDWLLTLLKPRVRIPGPDDVRHYLLAHPDMIDFVQSVSSKAWQKCEPPAQLSLEVYRDPELSDEYLTLYVRHSHYDREVLQAIQTLNKESQAEQVEKSGWLLISTDFSAPQ